MGKNAPQNHGKQKGLKLLLRLLAFNLATLQGATARLVDTIRNAETPTNFVPKTLQK